MKIYYVVIMLLWLPMVAVAKNDSLATIPLDQCSLQKVIPELKLESAEKAAAFARGMVKTASELDAISAKAKDPKASLQNQLSAKELKKFNTTAQQLKIMMVASLIESIYQRDLVVIQNLIDVADNIYKANRSPQKGEANYIYYEMLMVMRNKIPKDPSAPPTDGKCNLDYAIYRDASESIDRDKADAKKQLVYLDDIEYIRKMASVSQIMYDTYMHEIEVANGKTDKVENALNDKIKAGEISQEDVMYVTMWLTIDEVLPSNVAREFMQLNAKKNASH